MYIPARVHNQGISNFVAFVEHELYDRVLDRKDLVESMYTVFLEVSLRGVLWKVSKTEHSGIPGVVYSNEEVMNVVAERLNSINKGTQCK